MKYIKNPNKIRKNGYCIFPFSTCMEVVTNDCTNVCFINTTDDQEENDEENDTKKM